LLTDQTLSLLHGFPSGLTLKKTLFHICLNLLSLCFALYKPYNISNSALFALFISTCGEQNGETMLQQSFKQFFTFPFCYSSFSQIKSYCTLFIGLKNYFPPAYLSFFFFFFARFFLSLPSLCSPLSPLFSIDGLGSLLILETDLGLPTWWCGGSRHGGVGNGLGFSVDF
jgi:hypothetical protein